MTMVETSSTKSSFFFSIRPKPLGQALSQERGLRVPVAIAAQQQQLHESFRW
jgi:hypothetical protein